MVTSHVVDRIAEFNADRSPAGVKLKYAKMAASPLAFLRGTAHLFYADLPAARSVFQSAPPVWVCGDLHWENFGSYKGEDRSVYFNINDFDEGLLAPCTWDLARFLTSVIVGAGAFDFDQLQAIALCEEFLTAYTNALVTGKAAAIQEATAIGIVDDHLKQLARRDRADQLDERTTKSGKEDKQDKQRQLKLIKGKTVAIPSTERAKIISWCDDWAATQPNPEFYTILDVLHRIAGNGSLGLDRYLILVEGKGHPDRHYLLDLKASRASALHPYCPLPQPTWSSEADRIVQIQTRAQESPPAILHAIQPTPETSYVLRELQPTADKIELTDHQGKFDQFLPLVATMGAVTAWDQLRSGGRSGSAIADELIAFGARSASWQPDLLDYASAYAAQVNADYKTFSQHQ
jgi:uncharacterized protein (DUF2252 family)